MRTISTHNPLDLLPNPLPNVHMLAPQTLTRSEQEVLLQAVTQPRDHLIFSLARALCRLLMEAS